MGDGNGLKENGEWLTVITQDKYKNEWTKMVLDHCKSKIKEIDQTYEDYTKYGLQDNLNYRKFVCAVTNKYAVGPKFCDKTNLTKQNQNKCNGGVALTMRLPHHLYRNEENLKNQKQNVNTSEKKFAVINRGGHTRFKSDSEIKGRSNKITVHYTRTKRP